MGWLEDNWMKLANPSTMLMGGAEQAVNWAAPMPEGMPQTSVEEQAATQAKWNRYGQSNPYGRTSWSGTGPNATQNTTLAPGAQNAFNRLNATSGIPGVDGLSTGYIPTAPGPMARTQLPTVQRTATAALPNPNYVAPSAMPRIPGQRALPTVPGQTRLNVNRPTLTRNAPVPNSGPRVPQMNRLPQLPNAPQRGVDVPGQANVPGGQYESRVNDVSSALFEKSMARMRPEFDMQNRRSTQDLANMGQPEGSEFFNERSNRLAKQQNDAMLSAAMDATLAGGQEQSRLAGLDFARYDRGEDASRARFGMGLDAYGADLQGADFNRQNALSTYDRGEDATRARFGMGMDTAGLDLQRYGLGEDARRANFGMGMDLANMDLSEYDRREDQARSRFAMNTGNYDRGEDADRARFGMGMDSANANYAQRFGSEQALNGALMARADMDFNQRRASDSDYYNNDFRSAVLRGEEDRMAQRQPFEDSIRLSDMDFGRRLTAGNFNLNNQVTTQNANLDLIGRQMGQAPAMNNAPIDTMTPYQMQQNQAMLAQQLAQQNRSNMWNGISQLGGAAIMGGM